MFVDVRITNPRYGRMQFCVTKGRQVKICVTGSGAGVGLVVGFFEAVGGDVGVDLGGDEVGVAQEFLDAAEVGAGVQHVGRIAVAEFVGCEVWVEAGGGEVAL